MKIQLISGGNILDQFSSIAVCTKLGSPKSLDEFDIDIIYLGDKQLWYNNGDTYQSINEINNFKSLSEMIARKHAAKVVIVLPANTELMYNKYVSSNSYYYRVQLKDILDTVKNRILSKLIDWNKTFTNILFENTRTDVNSLEYEADFYFETLANVLTFSRSSKKPTTIELAAGSVYATTLDIVKDIPHLTNYISALFSPKQVEAVPGWMENVLFADDSRQKALIEEMKAHISDAQDKITEANAVLENNQRYKSILYTNGEQLVEIVFEILERLLDCDLSGFKDERNEDFLIRKPDCTYIGEIKGITSNVKNEHISQLDVHYQKYLEKLEEQGTEEDVHQILIINPFRTKPLEQRDPVNEQQIALAKRNGCLIIETETLLRAFEKYLSGNITSEQCISAFSYNTGLLKLDDFSKPG